MTNEHEQFKEAIVQGLQNSNVAISAAVLGDVADAVVGVLESSAELRQSCRDFCDQADARDKLLRSAPVESRTGAVPTEVIPVPESDTGSSHEAGEE